MSELTEYESNAIEKLSKTIYEGKWSNDGLVRLIELAGAYLNLQTIPGYSKANNISYNGVKKCRNIREIFDTKFVIDNE